MYDLSQQPLYKILPHDKVPSNWVGERVREKDKGENLTFEKHLKQVHCSKPVLKNIYKNVYRFYHNWKILYIQQAL